MKVGDIVRLKGLQNSMEMIVTSSDGKNLWVAYHDKEGRPHYLQYPKAVLERVRVGK